MAGRPPCRDSQGDQCWHFRVRGVGLDIGVGLEWLTACTHSTCDHGVRIRAGDRSRISLASTLQIKAGLRAAFITMLMKLQHAFVQRLPRQILSHEIGGVFCPQDLAQLKILFILPLLNPEAVDVDVPHLAGTVSPGDGQGCRGVGIYNALAISAEISQHAPQSQEFG